MSADRGWIALGFAGAIRRRQLRATQCVAHLHGFAVNVGTHRLPRRWTSTQRRLSRGRLFPPGPPRHIAAAGVAAQEKVWAAAAMACMGFGKQDGCSSAAFPAAPWYCSLNVRAGSRCSSKLAVQADWADGCNASSQRGTPSQGFALTGAAAAALARAEGAWGWVAEGAWGWVAAGA